MPEQANALLQRRTFLASALSLLPLLAGRRAEAAVARSRQSADFWRDKLSPAAWRVLFAADTEPPGSSPLNQEKRLGTYLCAACYLPLFASDAKYNSGTGWPSFTAPIAANHVGQQLDHTLWMERTEYHCARCGGHQGHLFADGPPPRGERWCNNGLALRFLPAGESLPALRGGGG